MKDSVAVRGANAATGFVLSALLVCGVIVVSDTGTYALPTGQWHAPPAQGTQPDAPGDAPSADATRQSITVPFTVRQQKARDGRPSVRFASVETRPERVTDRRGDTHPGRARWATGSNQHRSERGGRRGQPSSQRDAVSAVHGKGQGVRTFRSTVGSAPLGRGF